MVDVSYWSDAVPLTVVHDSGCTLVCVSVGQDIRDLKDLPKLIIVDMTGNPLVAAEDYRLYTVYFLRKLKVCRLHALPNLALSPDTRLQHTLVLTAMLSSGQRNLMVMVCVQVLDGVSVDGDEVAASKDVYSGRLTAELLEEKIGRCHACISQSSACVDQLSNRFASFYCPLLCRTLPF